MLSRPLLFVLLLLGLLSSCASKYATLSRNYPFKSEDGAPHYEDLDYWAAHPWKWDPSDSVPAPLRGEPRDSVADVFFLYPTSFTKGPNKGNAAIDDPEINAKTDYTSILYQASAFNQHARIFSPRYRQAHIKNFFEKDSAKAKACFELAYKDVRNAFLYYIEHWNKGRPFIIASHSQGSLMAEWLYKDLIQNRPLEKQMIAAYIVGWPIAKQFVPEDKICKDDSSTQCLCSWRTLKKGFVPFYLKNEKGNAWATNPLNWKHTGEKAGRKENKGSLLLHFNRIYPHTTDGWISNGLLYVHKPRFPWSFLIFKRNYHVGDINLFYVNLRENVATRIRQYNSRKPE